MTTINWSGFTWYVKTGYGAPGPNNWSDGSSDVYVDAQGRLHLKIVNRGGVWYCTEIISADTFGYGTYTFNVSPMSIDPNVILGLFTYLDDSHEIDIEMSQWGNPSDYNNIGYTVQPPPYTQNNHHRFNLPLNLPTSNSFTWNPSQVNFLSQTSTKSEPFTATGYIPPSSYEKVRLNLWLYLGNAPFNYTDQEVIVDSFRFNGSGGGGGGGIGGFSKTGILLTVTAAIVVLLVLRKFTR